MNVVKSGRQWYVKDVKGINDAPTATNNMYSVEKHLLKIIILGVIVTVYSSVIGNRLKLCIVIESILFVFLLIDIIKIIYNRRKIVREKKNPYILVIEVYTTNTVILSSLVWILQQYDRGSFANLNSYFDSLYYVIVSFSTIGYGDITPLSIGAKCLAVLIIFSYFLLLIIFLNSFVLRLRKKDDYLYNVIFEISFLFEQMASSCGMVDNSYKKKYLNWSEWVGVFISIIEKNAEENPEIVEENERKIKMIQKQNSSCEESFSHEIPCLFINGKDELLIKNLIDSGNRVIEVIEFLEKHKIILLENENLTNKHFYILRDIKESFYYTRNYRYGIKKGNQAMNALKKDLYHNLSLLGFQSYNDVKFSGFGENDDDLMAAVMRVDLNNRNDVLWNNIKSKMNEVLKL